jgi:hypothetical protein
MKKIGIIQSRGIGDLIIALPIAKHYHDNGYMVYWPICEQFIASMRPTVPWVHWISVPVDYRGEFFYNTPRAELLAAGIPEENHIWLYQYLSSHPTKVCLHR